MSIENIKKLREMTGAGMLDVKKALDASDDNIEKAIEWLRKNGVAKAAKKADRIAAEGVVSISSNDKRAIIAEINAETDFVASNEEFKKGVKEISDALLNSDVKTDDLETAMKISTSNGTIEELLISLNSTIGEKITLRRFATFNLEGKVAGLYLHSNSKIATAIIAEGMEQEILKDIAMHATAMSPEYLSMDDISPEVVEKETEMAKVLLKDALAGKPEQAQAGMIKGKVNKTFAESTLLEQQFVKDASKKIKDLQGSGKIVEYVRYEVGEGIEKASNNFADEVAAQVASAK